MKPLNPMPFLLISGCTSCTTRSHEEGKPKEQWFGAFLHPGSGKIVQIMSSSRLKLFSSLTFKDIRGKTLILKLWGC